MKLHLEPTSKVVEVVGPTGAVPARVWEGTTDAGIAVSALITRLAVLAGSDMAAFEADLESCLPPGVHADAWPARLVL